jgi:hypothetical protein
MHHMDSLASRSLELVDLSVRRLVLGLDAAVSNQALFRGREEGLPCGKP